MGRGRQWRWAAAGVALLGLLGLTLAWWLPDEESLRVRAQTELQSRLGVPVHLGALHWRLWPVPALVLHDAATGQPQPITVKKLTAYPRLAALLQRRLVLDRVEIDGAVVPQLSLRGLGGAPQGADADPAAAVLQRLVFRDLSWVSRHGLAVAYDGDIDFDAGWRPRQASLRRPGVEPVTDLHLVRQGQEDRWAARIRVGGGSADGELRLQTGADGALALDGRLKPTDIEVASAVAAFKRKPVIAGKASGSTVLSARADSLAGLAQSLHTQTTFTMGPSTLLNVDLDQAIRSAGQSHAGQTPLDTVSGRLDTQNTPQGMVLRYTELQARSGVLSASGQARLANRQIEAEFAVDLVGGLVGVPLRLSGPVAQVAVSVPPGAVAGAVLGTAVLPGVGTAIGARIGATLGRIFNPEPAPAAAPPAKPP